MSAIIRRIALALGLVLISTLSASCGDGGESSNAQCELSCVEEYASEAKECGNRETQCLTTCSSADDIDCTWDCEDELFECQGRHVRCAGRCSCAKEVVSCARDCPDEDTACLISCAESYEDCAGIDSPYLCAVACDTEVFTCSYGCEDISFDSSEFLTCRNACTGEHSSCLKACD